MKYDGRTLKYAILGLLIRNSMTGYDISKQFEKNISEFWTAKHSQIYPELKRLVSENLISYEITVSGEVLQKKLYSISQKGIQAFMEWLSKDEAIENPPKDVFRLRIYFFDLLPVDTQLELLTTQLTQHQERLSHLEYKYRQYEQIPDRKNPQIGDYLVLYGAILRERSQIAWLERCKELLQK